MVIWVDGGLESSCLDTNNVTQTARSFNPTTVKQPSAACFIYFIRCLQPGMVFSHDHFPHYKATHSLKVTQFSTLRSSKQITVALGYGFAFQPANEIHLNFLLRLAQTSFGAERLIVRRTRGLIYIAEVASTLKEKHYPQNWYVKFFLNFYF